MNDTCTIYILTGCGAEMYPPKASFLFEEMQDARKESYELAVSRLSHTELDISYCNLFETSAIIETSGDWLEWEIATLEFPCPNQY